MRGRHLPAPVLVALAAALSLLSAGAQSGASSGEWTQFRFDPAHSGNNPAETSITPANAATLAQAWAGSTGGIDTSSPAVAAGVAYVGSLDHRLYAFDADGSVGCSGMPKTCAPLWTGLTGDQVVSSPAVSAGVVYVGSLDHKLYAFDAAGTVGCSGTPKTCAPLWTATTGDAVWSAPAVSAGVAYVESGNAESGNGELYAFDAAGSVGCSGTPKTCAPLWTAPTGAASLSSPAVAGGVVYVGSDDANLYAFDAAGSVGCSGTPKTCAPLWTYRTHGAVHSSPAVVGGLVYVGADDGKLYAFDAGGSTGCSGTPKTCTPLWTADTGDDIHDSPAVAGGAVFVGGYFDGKLYAFDAGGSTGCSGTPKTCTPLWTAATGGAIRWSSPAVAGGVAYVGSDDRKLYAFDAAGSVGCSGTPKTCVPLWSATTGGQVTSSPAVAGGTVYVGSGLQLYAFAPAAADLAVAAKASPDPATEHKRLTYTLTVTNGGPSDASGVTLTDNLPAGVAFRSMSTSQGSCSRSSTVVTCPLGSLAKGASATVTIVVIPGNSGTVTNRASVNGTPTDPNPADNSASLTTVVRT